MFQLDKKKKTLDTPLPASAPSRDRAQHLPKTKQHKPRTEPVLLMLMLGVARHTQCTVSCARAPSSRVRCALRWLSRGACGATAACPRSGGNPCETQAGEQGSRCFPTAEVSPWKLKKVPWLDLRKWMERSTQERARLMKQPASATCRSQARSASRPSRRPRLRRASRPPCSVIHSLSHACPCLRTTHPPLPLPFLSSIPCTGHAGTPVRRDQADR